MKEIIVNETLDFLDLYQLEGNIQKTIEMLQDLQKRYPGELSLELKRKDYNDDQEYAVITKRPENEKEKAKRLEQEYQRKAYRKAEYERLKKEFEP